MNGKVVRLTKQEREAIAEWQNLGGNGIGNCYLELRGTGAVVRGGTAGDTAYEKICNSALPTPLRLVRRHNNEGHTLWVQSCFQNKIHAETVRELLADALPILNDKTLTAWKKWLKISALNDKYSAVTGYYFRDVCEKHVQFGCHRIAFTELNRIGKLLGLTRKEMYPPRKNKKDAENA